MSVQANMNDNPAAAVNNKHHTWNTSNTWSVQTQQELEEELFGRGVGDPDTFGYPGQIEEAVSHEPIDPQPF